MNKKCVIIGSGPAGTFAAKKIREKDDSAEIIIITEESYPMYSRPRLMDLIRGEIITDELLVFDEEWYKKNRIEVKLNSAIANISLEQKDIELEGGEFVVFDRLLLSVGSRPVLPPLKIASIANIFKLRTIEDAVEIKKISTMARSIVIIGGGLIGIESAIGFSNLGLRVTIIEAKENLLLLYLDEEGADILKKKLESLNIDVYLGSEVVSVGSRGVKLCKEEEIEADFILISSGVCPSTDLAEKCGIKVQRGIVVDNFMQTSTKNVYAAGDCCENMGCFCGTWQTAKEQGEAAALNMIGEKTEYKLSSMVFRMGVNGLEVGCIGCLEKIKSIDGIVEFTERKDDNYVKIYVKDGILQGVVCIGNIKPLNDLNSLMIKSKNISGKEEELMNKFF